MKFKNFTSYEGSREQLKAYAAELVKAGFKPDDDSFYGKWQEDRTFILTYKYGKFLFSNHDGDSFGCLLFHPDQFAEALASATKRTL